eukprot:jgi/Orpsp1_1/1192066/evm.model.d7180000090323.1
MCTMTEEILFMEKDIVNKEYYDSIKELVKCPICLSIVREPVHCTTCQHIFCSVCAKNLEKCPFRCHNEKFTPSLICKNLLSELKIKCQCGKEIKYDFFGKHKKKEECIFTNSLKKKYNENKNASYFQKLLSNMEF